MSHAPALGLTPDPGAVLERLYERLPEHYRTADAAADYPLYRWLAGICRELSMVEALRRRIDFVSVNDGGEPGDTSELVDPEVADASWLRWLAQLVGVPYNPSDTEASIRDAIQFASSGWRAGTKVGIAAAARTALTGTKHTEVYDHSITAPGDGGPFDVLLVTAISETPDVNAVLATVVAKGAKPAGVILRHRAYSASWAELEAGFTTWNAIEAVGSWTALEETGL